MFLNIGVVLVKLTVQAWELIGKQYTIGYNLHFKFG